MIIKKQIRSGIIFAALLFATVILGSILLVDHDMAEPELLDKVKAEPLNAAPARLTITAARLHALRWQELGSIISEVSADPVQIKRISEIIENSNSPVNLYLRALLILAQNDPAKALSVFDTIDIDTMPADFLYAPHRLHSSLRPNVHDRYLEILQQAVKNNKSSSLIKARVLAGDGKLEQALSSYMQTDPASWAQYDLVLFSKITSYQGLSIDLTRMISGAIASGRVKKNLEPKLKQLTRQTVSQAEISALEQRIKHGIKNGTPEGKIVLESARRLLRDRKIFLNRNYEQLLGLYTSSEPIKLATETLLLLFLSAVDQKHSLQAEIWGQELKRRHTESEVTIWVNKLMVTL